MYRGKQKSLQLVFRRYILNRLPHIEVYVMVKLVGHHEGQTRFPANSNSCRSSTAAGDVLRNKSKKAKHLLIVWLAAMFVPLIWPASARSVSVSKARLLWFNKKLRMVVASERTWFGWPTESTVRPSVSVLYGDWWRGRSAGIDRRGL